MYEPEKLEKYAEKIYMRYEYFNDYALQTIGRRIKATGKLSAYDQQTLKNMADISGDMKEITKQLAEITKMNVADIEAVYTQVISDGVDTYKPLYDFKGMKFVPFSKNEFAQQLVKFWAVRTSGEMINLSQTKALCFDKYNAFGEIIGSVPLQGAYEQAMSEAVQAVSAGTVDFNTAMKKTVERLGGSGVKVNYGNGVTRNLSSAIRQNILWGAKQSAKDYEKHVSDELGMDGFEVDAHSGCRPTHLFMQGKMYSYNGRKVIDGIVYEDGTEALARLEDYGCLHYKTGVILGVSEPRYSEEELDQIYKESTELIEYNGKEKTLYEWKQTQRRLERETKKAVQQSKMFKAAGNNREAERYAEKSAAYRRTYDDLCKKLNLPPKLERMAVYADKSLTNSGGGGIINMNRGANMRIDKFTPCLEDSKTGEILSTSFTLVQKEELQQLKGWKFDWTDTSLNDSQIYKLTLKDDNEIQGLISLSNFEKDRAVYINIVESAPHNLGVNKKYNGVGGHLYAIAAKKSVDNGFGGFLFMDAKNYELVEHYEKTLGAVLIGRPHPYRMIVDEDAANKLLEIYTLEGE